MMAMNVFFAGVPVKNYQTACTWYDPNCDGRACKKGFSAADGEQKVRVLVPAFNLHLNCYVAYIKPISGRIHLEP